MLAAAVFPAVGESTKAGLEGMLWTIRLAVLYYGVAAGLMLTLAGDDWSAATIRGALARSCWTLAWAAYVIHVALAFHYYHHWSHIDAIQHTENVSGFGPGIWFSHLFTLLWGLDIAWWWLRPDEYAHRPPRIGRVLHTFMAFIVFNGTCIFASGPVRWFGVAVFGVLGFLWLRRVFLAHQGRKKRNATDGIRGVVIGDTR